jgi:hypothetical protein
MALTLQQAPVRLAWPPAVRAILWMDAVLLLGAGIALAGKPPALQQADFSTWLMLAGSTLTSVLAALAAFQLCAPKANPAWRLLPVAPVVLWAAASGLGYLALPLRARTWGGSPAEAGECLGFLLTTGLPLLAVFVFMLRRVASVAPPNVFAMAALASTGAAASLLTLVHPHTGSILDLCAHLGAFAMLLGVGVLASRAGKP